MENRTYNTTEYMEVDKRYNSSTTVNNRPEYMQDAQ